MFINHHKPLTNNPWGCSQLEKTLHRKLYLSLFHWHWLTTELYEFEHFRLIVFVHIQTEPSSLTSYLMFSSRHCVFQKHFVPGQNNAPWLNNALQGEVICHFLSPSERFACQRVKKKKNDYDGNLKQFNKVTLGYFSLVKTLKALEMLLKLYGFFFPFYSRSKITF